MYEKKCTAPWLLSTFTVLELSAGFRYSNDRSQTVGSEYYDTIYRTDLLCRHENHIRLNTPSVQRWNTDFVTVFQLCRSRAPLRYSPVESGILIEPSLFQALLIRRLEKAHGAGERREK